MMGSLRLKLFTMQTVEPALTVQLERLAADLTQTAATRHAVDLAVAKWQKNWRDIVRPRLIGEAVVILLDDEELKAVRRDDPADGHSFERLATALALDAIDACAPRLRSGAEQLRRERLSVH